MSEMIVIFDGRTRELGISLRHRYHREWGAALVTDNVNRYFSRHGFAFSFGRFELDYDAYLDGELPPIPGVDTSMNCKWLLVDQHARCYNVTSFWCTDDNVRKYDLSSLPLHEGASWVLVEDLDTVRDMVSGALRAGASKEQLESLIDESVTGIYGKIVWMKVDDIVADVRQRVQESENDLAQDQCKGR